MTVNHNGYTLIQSERYIPERGGYPYIIVDAEMNLVKTGVEKHKLVPKEAEWKIDMLRMEGEQ